MKPHASSGGGSNQVFAALFGGSKDDMPKPNLSEADMYEPDVDPVNRVTYDRPAAKSGTAVLATLDNKSA